MTASTTQSDARDVPHLERASMNAFSLASLRVRILVMILVVLTPALGLILHSSHEQRIHKIGDVERDVTALAQLVSAEEERLLEEARALLMGLAMSWELQDGRHDNCASLLNRVLANNPHYRNFGVVDSAGRLRCSARPFRPGLDLSDRLYIRRAIEQRGFGVGGYQIGRVTGEQTINFGYPVFGPGGAIDGVVYGALGLDALDRSAEEVMQMIPEEAVLTKMDQDGIVLTRNPDDGRVGKEAPEFALIRDRLRDGSGCLRAVNERGEAALLSFAPVRSRMSEGEVYVVLCVPERVAFAAVNREGLRNLALLGLTAALALALAWIGANLAFARPMKHLTEATSALRLGDLTVRIGEPYPRGEFGELARGFDGMAETLQQRQRERDDAEAALRLSEQDYRSMWEHAPYGILRTTRAGKIIMANPAVVRMLGYESERELIDRRTAAELYVDPDDREDIFERFKDQETGAGIQVRWRRKNGQELLVSFNGRRMRDESGREIGYELFIENETERRRLEDQLSQAQKMEAVGRLAGGVAHDFNNLLGVMLGYSNMMLDNLQPDDPNHERVKEIRQATEKAAALTQQLLFISRRQVMEPQILDLSSVVGGMESMLRSLLGESIQLEIEAGENLDSVRADPGQMEQVLLNLVVNARDAMPEGGRVTIVTENTDLAAPIVDEGTCVEPGRYVRLTVTDTGQGMDAETQKRVFEPFFTTKPKEKGSGLGLSTVQGIVDRSGGAVRLLSKAGQGARFEIYLPVTVARPKPAVAPTLAKPFRMGPETILLVEDEESLRTMVRRFLEGEGYRVMEARSGTHALELAQRHQGTIHLLITDVIMPRLSGREVAERIRKLRPEIRILFVSGYADDVIVDHGALMEGAAFLAKPFAPDVLLRKVQEVVGEG